MPEPTVYFNTGVAGIHGDKFFIPGSLLYEPSDCIKHGLLQFMKYICMWGNHTNTYQLDELTVTTLQHNELLYMFEVKQEYSETIKSVLASRGIETLNLR